MKVSPLLLVSPSPLSLSPHHPFFLSSPQAHLGGKMYRFCTNEYRFCIGFLTFYIPKSPRRYTPRRIEYAAKSKPVC